MSRGGRSESVYSSTVVCRLMLLLVGCRACCASCSKNSILLVSYIPRERGSGEAVS